MSPTITVSKAMKGELGDIKEREGLYSLDEAINHVLRNPLPGHKELEGPERTLTEPVRVKHRTRNTLRRLRDRGAYADFEAILRDRVGAVKRDTGTEEPIPVDPLP